MMRTNTNTLLALMSDEGSCAQLDLDGRIDRVMTFAAERSGSSWTMPRHIWSRL